MCKLGLLCSANSISTDARNHELRYSHEESVIVLLDGKDLEPPIANVQHGTAGGDVAWTPDGKGIYYTKYTDGNFFVQVWFHQLGTTVDKDHYEIAKDQPKIGEFMIDTDKRGRVLVQIHDGDGGMFRHYLRDDQARERIRRNSREYFDRYLHRDQLARYYVSVFFDMIA